MIYREFLLFVLCPLIGIAVVLYLRHARGSKLAPIGVLAVVALVYTTPWDGWLIRTGVWSYPPGSVLGTLFDVPFEEFCFMVGQTVLTGLLTLTVLRLSPPPLSLPNGRRRRVVAACWLAATVVGGVLAATTTSLLYLGVILVWFGPPLALQAAYGADLLRTARPQRLIALSSTVVLWAADVLAIQTGAWRISTTHTSGVTLVTLPVEEAVFFLVTNMLVVNSLILLTVRRREGAPCAPSQDQPTTLSSSAPD